MKRTDSVAVLDKTLDVLEALLARPDQTVAEISKATDITKAAVYRILSTLESRSYVVTHAKVRRYSIGQSFHQYVAAARASDRLLQVARPVMRRLWEETGETINLGILVRREVQYLEIMESWQSLRATGEVGAFEALHCTALGKAILSRHPDELREKILAKAELTARTEHTVTNIENLRRAIRQAGEVGFAPDNEENEIGMRCVAAPILNAAGSPLSALSVSGPRSRMTDEALLTIAAKLIESCAEITRLLDDDVPPLVRTISD